MWPVTRRICANVADHRLTAAVIEVLEARRMLTVAAADSAPPTEWEFRGAYGEHRGTATLVGGILRVVTTSGSENIEIGTTADPDVIGIVVLGISDTPQDYSQVRGLQIDRSRVSGIVVDAGDGNDGVYFFDHGALVNLPVTMNGGAG